MTRTPMPQPAWAHFLKWYNKSMDQKGSRGGLLQILWLVIIAAAFFLYFQNDIGVLYKNIQTWEKSVGISINNIQEQINAPEPLKLPTIPGITPSATKLTAAGVIAETNLERKKYGLPGLTENALLDLAAQKKANDMLAKQYFEHIAPDGTGPAELSKSVGYQYTIIGENLALGDFKDDADLVDAWMNSTGHRENIQHPRYTEIGVAAARGMYEGAMVWVAVQEFGLPLSACPNPDPQLKAQISAEQTILNGYKTALDTLRTELDKYPNKGDSEYNRKARDYNELVKQYNALVDKLKSETTEYNAEVNAFNACVKG